MKRFVRPAEVSLRSCSSQDSIERNPDRSQDSSFDLFHELLGELPAERALAEKLLRERRDLLALQYAVLRDSTLSALEPDVNGSVAPHRTRRDHQNVAGKSVARPKRPGRVASCECVLRG